MPKITLNSIKCVEPSEGPGDELFFIVGYARCKWPNGDILHSDARAYDKGNSFYESEEGDKLKPKLPLLDGLNPDEGAILIFTAWEHDSSSDGDRKKAAKLVEKVATRAARRMPHDLEVALGSAAAGGLAAVTVPDITKAIASAIDLAKEVIKAVGLLEEILSSPDDLIGGVQLAMYRKPSGETAWSFSTGEGMTKGKKTEEGLSATFSGDTSRYLFNFGVDLS